VAASASWRPLVYLDLLLRVLATRVGDLAARIRQRAEPMFVQALAAELPVESLDVSVLRRLTRLDQAQLDPVRIHPGVHRLEGKLRPLVRADRRRQRPKATRGGVFVLSL